MTNPRAQSVRSKRGKTKLARVARAQGRKYRWIAHETGYSEGTVGAVARGERAGTLPFYKAVSRLLGEDVSP